MIPECLYDIVGLSRSACPCLDEKGEGIVIEGRSPYFLDDMEDGINLMMAQRSKDCGDGSIWDLMQRARIEGVNEFLTDFLALVQSRNALRYRNWSGQIGEKRKADNTLSKISAPWLGMKLTPRAVVGGYLTVTGLGLKVNTTGAYEVFLYEDRNLTTPLASVTVAATAGVQTIQALAAPLRVPLVDENRNPISYYVVYERGASKPYSTLFNCNCSGSAHGWETYLSGSSLTMADDDFSGLLTPSGGYTNGAIMQGSLACETGDFLCNLTNFKSDPFARVVAKTIQFYSLNKLIGYILRSSQINFYTLLEKEPLHGARNHNRKEASDRLQWLAENIPFDATDCLSCDGKKARVAAILV